jgi:hypothetical protein
MKPTFFKSLKDGFSALAKLGISGHGMNLKQMAVTYDEQLKRNKTASTPTTETTTSVKSPSASLDELKAAAKSISDPSLRVDALERVQAKCLSDFNAVDSGNFQAKTDASRELQKAQTNVAYAKLAESTFNPAAAKARRFAELID